MKRALQLAAVLCALCGLCGELRAQDTSTVILPIESAELHLRVSVEVNGKPAILLIDTGAAYTHLDSRFLKLPRARRSLRVTTGAGETELRVLEPVKLLLGGKVFDIETLDVNLAAQRRACACDVAGVLGLDVLRQFDSVTFDFKGKTLKLEVRGSRSEEKR